MNSGNYCCEWRYYYNFPFIFRISFTAMPLPIEVKWISTTFRVEETKKQDLLLPKRGGEEEEKGKEIDLFSGMEISLMNQSRGVFSCLVMS